MKKFIITSELRDLEKKVSKGEITYSKMIELLNEKAEQWHENKLKASKTNPLNVDSRSSILEIKETLDNCIDLYTDLFCKKQECYADGWIGDIKGGLNCFSDAFLSFEDIRIDLEMNAPKGDIFKWYWDNIENEGKAINYYSYVLGLRIKDINNKSKV